MHEKIKQILERELEKLDFMSKAIAEPLAAGDVKSLDTLIKAYRSFTAPDPTPPLAAANDPAQQSTETLLTGLNDNA